MGLTHFYNPYTNALRWEPKLAAAQSVAIKVISNYSARTGINARANVLNPTKVDCGKSAFAKQPLG